MPPRTRTQAPARTSSSVARRQTSLQGGRVSYYSSPGQGQTVTTTGGLQAGRVRSSGGNVYTVRSSSGQQLSGRLPSRTYHRIVLAEFLATVLVIGASPLVVPAKQTAEGDIAAAIATVSLAGPLVRLTAVCVIFFILALMASGEKSGKVAAAFGGLILAGAVINATDLWTALGHALGAGAAAATGQAGQEV
jgi:hypothetical protein